jgi:hypothetical protein
MRRQTVTTTPSLSPSQLSDLQRLGCEPTPFITRKDALFFAAQPTEESIEALRALDFVVSVKDMPVIVPC